MVHLAPEKLKPLLRLLWFLSRRGEITRSSSVLSPTGKVLEKEEIRNWHSEFCYYVDRLLHYIGYYVGNSKHQTISVITLSKNAEPRYYDVKILVPHNFCLIFSYNTCYDTHVGEF